ncbi:MAG TPA: thioredoxin-dependent thiol peroxidase [Candidatus Nanoarchaeia archaeon]|nr:thioredoxin-dependent thiol peroxidase [Candidatus Nanoarchaeia archaeon]
MLLKTNQKAPSFTLSNQEGKTVSLGDFKNKWVVLYFYPKDDTPGCTIEALDFTRWADKFKQNGAVIIGVSPDSLKSHCKFIDQHDLKLTLLSDEEKKVLAAYGVWGKKKFMGREYMGVLRTTFLINRDGKIVKIWENVNVKGHAEEVLSTLTNLSR